MSLQAKKQKLVSFLPPNKQIFMTYAQFQSTQLVSDDMKSQFFDNHLAQISKMFAQAFYSSKDAQEIDQLDVITDLEQWLSSEGVKFHLRRNPQAKVQRLQRRPQLPQTRIPEQQTPNRASNQQGNISPKPQRRQPIQQYPPQNVPQTYTPPISQPQTRPQTYYQNPPPQGRPTAVKYAQKQTQQPQPLSSNQHLQNEQNLIKRQQYEKHFSWIDNLSKCLTYPEKRFYIMPEMHPKRKF